MQLEQSFDLPASPALAWPAFKNVELFVECLPGGRWHRHRTAPAPARTAQADPRHAGVQAFAQPLVGR